jgi:hypothetical protein
MTAVLCRRLETAGGGHMVVCSIVQWDDIACRYDRVP